MDEPFPTPSAERRGDNLPGPLVQGLSRRHIPALDGLRAIAAYLVVFFHFGLAWVPGGLGVLAFFVLSGFLITWLLLAEAEQYGEVSLRLFWTRRALRIFPAFYVFAIGSLSIVAVLGKRNVPGQTVAALLYVSNYYQALAGDPNTGLSHTWSLAVEEQFYLIWPIAFIAIQRKRFPLAKCLMGAIAVVWLHRWLLVWLGVPQGYIYEAFDTRADHLMIGCLLAVLLREGRWAPFWRAVSSRTAAPALTFGLLAISSALAYHINGFRDVIGFVVDPLLVAVLIAQLIGQSQTGPWTWLNASPIRYLGRISYSVYLYQQVVPGFVEALLRHWPAELQMAASLAGVTLVASGSYWFVERPFLALRDRFGRRARTEAVHLTPSVATS